MTAPPARGYDWYPIGAVASGGCCCCCCCCCEGAGGGTSRSTFDTPRYSTGKPRVPRRWRGNVTRRSTSRGELVRPLARYSGRGQGEGSARLTIDRLITCPARTLTPTLSRSTGRGGKRSTA